jgi:non-ribosomal peptide synthetase component F
MNGLSSDERSRDRPVSEPPKVDPAERLRAYARREFSGLPECLELPATGPRPQIPLYTVRRAAVNLSARLAAGIEALAHRLAVPVVVPLLAGWAALLARWSGQDDLVIGVRMPGRSPVDGEPLDAGVSITVGVRCRLREDPAVKRFLQELKSGLRKAVSRQDVGFDLMAADLRRSGEAIPDLQATIALNLTPEDQSAPDDSRQTRLELAVSLAKTSAGFTGTLDYASELFAPEMVERLLEGWQVLLEAMIENVYQSVGSLPIMVRRDVASDISAVLAGARATRCAFSVGASPIPVSVGAPGSRPQV